MILLLFSFSITGSDGLNHWWRDGSGDYTENRFSINVKEKKLGLSLYSIIYLKPYANGMENHIWPSFYGKYDLLWFRIGAYHHTALEGLLIRMNQNPDFRIYRWMKGIYIGTRIGPTEWNGFWGTPENLEFNDFSYNTVNDTGHMIIGADGIINLKPLKMKLGYLRMRDKNDLSPTAFTELYGGGINLSLSIVEVFFNYIKKAGCRPLIGGRYNGNGYFGGLGLYLPAAGIQIFYEDYDSIGLGEGIYRYNDPPTITKSEYSINRGMDEKGIALLSNLSIGDAYLELNLARINTSDRSKVVEDHGIKVEKDNLLIDYEYLYLRKFEPEVLNKVEHRSLIEYDFNLIIPLQITAKFNPIKADTLRYIEYGGEVSGSFKGFSLTAGYERRTKMVEYLEERTKWRKVELKWDRGNGLIMGIFVGEEKGGLVCSGGVCRWETPFRGVRFFLSKRL